MTTVITLPSTGITIDPPSVLANHSPSKSTITKEPDRPVPMTTSAIPTPIERHSYDSLKGMRLLNITLPDDISKKVTSNYAGLTPMNRFMLETVGVRDTLERFEGEDVIPAQEEEGSVCASCAATIGSGNQRDTVGL
jgi:hypothetical protein